MKGMLLYVFGFFLVIVSAVFLGNFDSITPTVVEARAETSVGVTTMSVFNQGLALVFKLILGATVAGLAGAAFVEGRKLYRHWWIGQRTRRWRPGPNANYQQQQQQQKLPKLTREDLLFMALANQGRVPRAGSRSAPRSSFRDQEVSDEIDFDL